MLTESFSKKQGLVVASQTTEKVILVLQTTGEWTPLNSLIVEKGWTIKYLKQRNKL